MGAASRLGKKFAPFLFVVVVLLTPLTADGQEGWGTTLTTKMKELAASLLNKGAFTIAKIEPNPKDNSILIYLTDHCGLYELRQNLRLIPPAPLQWNNSSVSEQNILTLRGNFKPGRQYVVILPPDFKSANGRTYTKNVNSFTMPDRQPEITFLGQGNVIERDSRQMLHVQIMNINEVLFQGLRIPPIMIPDALQQIQGSPEKPLSELKEGLLSAAAHLQQALGKEPDFREFTGRVIEEKQLFFAQKELNIFHQFSIPLSFREEKEKGAIEIVRIISNRKDQPAQTSLKLFRITDIGLTYKTSDDSLLLWTTSLYSGRPLSEVSILAFTAASEAVPLGKTDAKGILNIKKGIAKKHASLTTGQVTTRPLSLDEIEMVAAVLPNDQSFVEIIPQGNLKQAGVKEARHERKAKKKLKSKSNQLSVKVVGDEKNAKDLLRGHLFTERGIYRPGETVHFKGTIREYKEGRIAPPGGEAVAGFKIVNSKNEEIYKKDIKTSEFGTAHDKFNLKAYFPLGTYTIYMRYGKEDSETASRTFEVQEFRQPRHYVEIIYKRESKKDDGLINLSIKKEILNCEIFGKYYAGGPVKHGRVRWNIYHTRTDYSRPDHPGYTFGYPVEAKSELIESGESLLDENGKIAIPVPLGKEVLSGKYGIEVLASVVDFDGRASSESAVYQGDPDYIVGISSHPPTVQSGESQTLSAVVIDKKGRKVSKGAVAVHVMEKGWTYIQKRNPEGHLYDDRQMIWRKQLSVELPIKDEMAAFEFDFSRGGEYLVSFSYTASDGRQYTSGTMYKVPGYYYDYEYEQRDTSKIFERLGMYSEKPLYTAGETIKIYLSPSRPLSTCLVTIEQEKLIEFKTVELKPDQRTLEFPVKNAFNPNVYISALCTVARSSFPVYTSQFDIDAPSFLFGTVNVEVKGEQQKIKIAVNEEQKKLKSLPGSEMTITINTTDQEGKGVASELAVGVVDESILAMTGYETPSLDILGKFIIPLGVFTGELRTDILRQTPFGFLRNAPLTGGDGMEQSPEAVTSKIRKDFNPVAYFNPSVITDEKGQAKVNFKFPDTMTTYRIYVVASDKGSRFGSYQRSALVIKDFYLEPGLPAFLTRGDKLKFSVSAFNKTEKSGPAEFSLKTDELLSLSVPSATYPMGSHDRKLIPVEGTVLKAGTTQILFSGKFKENSDAVELKLPVNSGHVLGSDLLFGQFRREAQVKYNLPKAVKELRWEDVGPGEVSALLMVSGSPFVRMSQGLQYLLRYPYGCVEQTSSGLLPLAALREIIRKEQVPDITTAETDKFIKPGIDRLFSMQTTAGGFGYWSGDQQPHKWGSIYALTAITRAKLAGFDLPAERMDRAINYLKNTIKDSGKTEYTFRAFGAYILALNSRLDQETFNWVFENIDSQPREAAMLILMSGKISKFLPDEAAKVKLRAIMGRPIGADRVSDEFYARYREPAISLLAATLILPGEEITDRVAARLMGGMNPEGIWTSTSDTGWSLLALNEYFSGGKTDSSPTTVTVRHGGKVVESFTLDPKGYRTIALDPREFLKNPAFTITAGTDQTLLYRLALTFPRTDYAKNGYSNGFDIHKTIKNTDGTNTIRVGDIVEVRLKINIKNRDSNYVVIDDPLPAGFVAINSAIKTEEQIIAKKRQGRDIVGGEGDESDGEFGEGFGWSDWYWDPAGYYKFTPNFFEIRNDRVLAFRNRTWNGIYEYSYYARAVCEGEFVMPSTKIQLMYNPEVVAYTPQGRVAIKGK